MDCIREGQAILGMELGSTRIKAVLIGEDYKPVAMGTYDWENQLENGYWTYSLEKVQEGVRGAYASLKADVQEKYGITLTRLGGIGVSAMMHGYLAFDTNGELLVPFRTWRNTTTGEAAEQLTALFHFAIPQRWSIAHLHQAILNGEEHVRKIARLTTLAGYVHTLLTGKHVLGVGDASGMFPIDSETGTYDAGMMAEYDALLAERHMPWRLSDILPGVLNAGGDAGRLTESGARFLDPEGDLEAGVPAAPPEGDAGTGMVATNSVAVRTGNISAGTSAFAMVVLEKGLSRLHPEIDMVTTPSGRPVAMVHCNNCTSDINAWANMLHGFTEACGTPVSMGTIYENIFRQAMQGDADCGGMVNIPYLSGEHITGMAEGRPMLVRLPDANISFANFARSLVFGAMASLKLGMDILAEENVQIDSLLGHGGFFKTPGTAQRLMASALGIPVSVMETASEGGPWGMALLAAYRVQQEKGESLDEFLMDKVFAGAAGTAIGPEEADAEGFNAYMAFYMQALEAERAACAMNRE